jgi:hypothetical protein
MQANHSALFRSVFAALLLGCADASVPPVASGHAVQITKAYPAPTTILCGGGANGFLVLVNVHMANTTSSPVTLQGVSSAAQYVRPEALSGTFLLVSPSLPFTPLYLRANDGSNYTTVSVKGTCPGPSGYGDFYLSLFLTTDSGQYATPSMLLSFKF